MRSSSLRTFPWMAPLRSLANSCWMLRILSQTRMDKGNAVACGVGSFRTSRRSTGCRQAADALTASFYDTFDRTLRKGLASGARVVVSACRNVSHLLALPDARWS